MGSTKVCTHLAASVSRNALQMHFLKKTHSGLQCSDEKAQLLLQSCRPARGAPILHSTLHATPQPGTSQKHPPRSRNSLRKTSYKPYLHKNGWDAPWGTSLNRESRRNLTFAADTVHHPISPSTPRHHRVSQDWQCRTTHSDVAYQSCNRALDITVQSDHLTDCVQRVRPCCQSHCLEAVYPVPVAGPPCHLSHSPCACFVALHHRKTHATFTELGFMRHDQFAWPQYSAQ